MGQETGAIHRYTDLPALLYLLQRRQLTLLDPMSWDDKNDSHFLSLYKAAQKLKCLCAICFSEADETYHHWRVFAGGASGIRITFLRQPLLNLCAKKPGLQHRQVTYELLRNMRGRTPRVEDLPFLKRHPYQQENEYRIVYQSMDHLQRSVNIELPLTLIRRITLSPWMHEELADAVKTTIHGIPGCQKMKIGRSTLIGNDEWMAFGNRAVKAESAAAGNAAYRASGKGK
jgi:hypothetical protein